ncbi:MAG: hypothetical protein HOM11_10650 [Methylococcales bacterium]|mgnify:CR=1 FL=1|jgi:hypothetical protein|nr:hypothetical protein [Methylococcales bacterium]MBT7443522.1 hypothetical protein [Methylococcales bacterium]
MTFSVVKETNSVITVNYTESVSLKQRIHAVDKACSMIKPGELARLLIDVRNMTVAMTLNEQEYFGQYLAEQKCLKNA